MDNTSYEAIFTPCGRSIRSLKAEARSVQKELGITHSAALDQVARSVGYSHWQELIRQAPNPKRDQFFKDIYAGGAKEPSTQDLYQQHLKKIRASDSKDVFREFAVGQWADFQKLGFDNLTLDREPLSPKLFVEEIHSQLQRLGAVGLVPKELGDRVLETLVFVGRVMRGEYDGLPDEIFDKYMSCVCQQILLLIAYQKKSAEVTVSIDELEQRVMDLFLVGELELVARLTGLEVNTPDADTIFKPDCLLSFRVPKGFGES